MITRLKQFRDSLSEKIKTYVYIGTALLVFLIGCFLPLAFSGGADAKAERDSENAALFVKFSNNEKYVKKKVIKKVSNSKVNACEEKFNEIISEYIVDYAPRKTINEGSEFITVSFEGKSIELCRMWLQDQGDWTNWVDVYMDANTGFIYYLYVSSICVYNNDKYINAIEVAPDCKNIATSIAEKTGYNLEIVNWSGKSEDSAKVFTRLGGDALIWNVNCSYHPASLIDIKISVA